MFRAFTRPRYQVSVYRIIGPLVSDWQPLESKLLFIMLIDLCVWAAQKFLKAACMCGCLNN